VQVLDEQIAAAWRISEQRLYFGERRWFDGATLRVAGAAFAAALYVTAFQNTSSRTTRVPTS
jgi:glutathione S-transferase